MSRRRRLSDEDEALWTSVTRLVKPLRSKPKVKPAPLEPNAAPPAAAPDRAAASAAAASRQPPEKPLPLAPFDRRFRQRVARGRAGIDARIDLHGMTQSEAHGALLHFLRRVQSDGGKIALIVTGKGASRSGAGNPERGVLKRQVPLWLALPEFRRLIVGFDEAHVSHGGEGALYVRLRRIRD